MTSFQYHPAYDKHYDTLVLLLTDGETFSADLLEDLDFEARLKSLPLSLAEAQYATTLAKKKVFLNNLFVARKASTWFVLDNFEKYVKLWEAAITEGFLPDCVCTSGPTPSTVWKQTVTTPKKSVSRTFNVHPGQNLLDPASPAAQPLKLFSDPPPFLDPPAPDPAASLQAFLLGGGTGNPLPSSSDPGKTSVPTLPPLSVSASPLVAPHGQPIYDLEKFVTGYVAPSTSLVLQADGTFTAPKSARAINSPSSWMAAAHAFGNAMSVTPAPHQFNWPDFIVFIDTVSILLKHYTFDAVMSFEAEWRRWRRAYGHPWTQTNPLLRDAFLLGKHIQSTPSASTSKNKPSPPTALICHDFSRTGGCSRSTSCRYPHKCKRCNTTFPNTSLSCPCVSGLLPPGTVLPPGVTFGQ